MNKPTFSAEQVRGILAEARRAHDRNASELMRAASRHLRAAAFIESQLAETLERSTEQEDSAE